VMVATLLTLAYFIRLWVRVFGSDQVPSGTQRVEAPFALRVCVSTLTLGIIALGLFSDRIVRLLLDTTNSLGL
jgi:multicomponent Na+:H+ antiporter subunit D